jgi:hypothetical protein
LSDIQELNNSIQNEEELPDQWKKSIIVPVCKTFDKTGCSNDRGYHCYQLKEKYPTFSHAQVHVY